MVCSRFDRRPFPRGPTRAMAVLFLFVVSAAPFAAHAMDAASVVPNSHVASRIEPWEALPVNLDRLFGPYASRASNVRVDAAAVPLSHPWCADAAGGYAAVLAPTQVPPLAIVRHAPETIAVVRTPPVETIGS